MYVMQADIKMSSFMHLIVVLLIVGAKMMHSKDP